MTLTIDQAIMARLDVIARKVFGRRGVYVFIVRGTAIYARFYAPRDLAQLGAPPADGLAEAVTTYDPRREYLYLLCVPNPAQPDTLLVQWQRRPWPVQALVA